MLVLSRKLGEKIMIADNIVITVIDIDRGKVRIGIEAPREIPVHREEVYKSLHGITQEESPGKVPQPAK